MIFTPKRKLMRHPSAVGGNFHGRYYSICGVRHRRNSNTNITHWRAFLGGSVAHAGGRTTSLAGYPLWAKQQLILRMMAGDE